MILKEKRDFYYFDPVQPLVILFLLIIGLIFVASSTYSQNAPFSLFFKKQIFGTVTGCLIYIAALFVNHRLVLKTGYWLYFLLLCLLGFTLIKGSIGMGAQRWLDLGIIKFQPSELAKILFPTCAVFLIQQEQDSDPDRSLFSLFAPLFLILTISFVLIAKQPDLGTALIVLFSGFIICWFSGISTRFFLIVGLCGILAAPVFWNFLKPYQKQRITVFFGQGDFKKEGYQKEQALIAIGSGGLFGKGLLNGTQNKLSFLPEGRTDFIFAVICEEWGLCGALLVIALYLLLFGRMYSAICRVKNKNMQLFALGITIHIALSMLINCGMVLGILPIVGIPLPFISYGITHLWITLLCLGIFQNITMDRLYRTD
jgi:rod shape determining protein RodA